MATRMTSAGVGDPDCDGPAAPRDVGMQSMPTGDGAWINDIRAPVGSGRWIVPGPSRRYGPVGRWGGSALAGGGAPKAGPGPGAGSGGGRAGVPAPGGGGE